MNLILGQPKNEHWLSMYKSFLPYCRNLIKLDVSEVCQT